MLGRLMRQARALGMFIARDLQQGLSFLPARDSTIGVEAFSRRVSGHIYLAMEAAGGIFSTGSESEGHGREVSAL